MPNILKNAMPASLRMPSGSSRFAQNLIGRAVKPVPASPADRLNPVSVQMACFTSLPQEPEDARLTGATRSLNRRLLALNVGGTLLRRGRVVAA